MIRRVDDAVGDILQLLRDLGILNNTLIVFTSDNGPHNENGQDPSFFDSWGMMDGIKRDLWEAGIREPAMVCWPGHIRANSTSDFASGFWDWMPTFAELAGVPPPAQSDGVSLGPTLLGAGAQRSRGFLYWEYDFGGRRPGKQFPIDAQLFPRKGVHTRGQLQALRLGDFTAVRYTVTNSMVPFRLYNVVTDPHEDHDLSGYPTNAALLAKVAAMVREVRRPDPGARRPYDQDLVPSVSVGTPQPGRLEARVYHGAWPWVPDFDALSPVAKTTRAGLQVDGQNAAAQFGVAFNGYIRVPADGQYTFYLTSDSGAQMWLHEAHVIDDDFNHTGAEVSAAIRLQAGLHPLRLFYRHTSGSCHLELKYSGPGLEEQPVPVDAYCCAQGRAR